MSLFKKSKSTEDEPLELVVGPDALDLVPASAKSPDAQRRSLFDPDEEIDEGSDEDLAFLHSLVRPDGSSDTTLATAPVQASAPPPAPSTDDMEVFREMTALRTRTELAKQLRVDNVDMGDLVEDLHTTRAALRRLRKAA